MHKMKIISLVLIFSFLLGITSIIKNKTRVVEKKIVKIKKKISIVEKDFHETELDYSYLSSPGYLSKKMEELNFTDYFPMDFSRIYLSYSNFRSSKNKITIFKNNNEQKIQKK